MEIKLKNNHILLIDEEDWQKVNHLKWTAHKRPHDNCYYALTTDYSSGKPKLQLIHRLIMNAPKNMTVDHINGNGLDNRRNNLRLATRKENARNQKLNKKSTTGFKGVSFHKRDKKYTAQIKLDKLMHLGYFENPIEAAIAYDTAAKKYFGEFANLNFKKARE